MSRLESILREKLSFQMRGERLSQLALEQEQEIKELTDIVSRQSKFIIEQEHKMGREADVINGLLKETADQKAQIAALQAQVDAVPAKDAADLAAEDAGAAEIGLVAAPVNPGA